MIPPWAGFSIRESYKGVYLLTMVRKYIIIFDRFFNVGCREWLRE